MFPRAALILQRLIPAARPVIARRQHRAMFAVDIAGFSSREPQVQMYLRQVLYRIVQDACDLVGLPWDDCHHEDRGDGILVIAQPGADFDLLLNPLATRIGADLRAHNRTAGGHARLRLRMSVHAGYVQCDDHGVAGADVIHLFRLLDAPALKNQLADHDDDLALIVSHYLYEVATGYGSIDPAGYRPISVDLKETHARAWIRLPAPVSGPAPDLRQIVAPPGHPPFALLIPVNLVQPGPGGVHAGPGGKQEPDPAGAPAVTCPVLAQLIGRSGLTPPAATPAEFPHPPRPNRPFHS
ncbi:hypothetical protein ACRYCC_14795 [Actinomadura scrupuli]|uniref:hypothetical protein n=1 Tax=Actinomadura scrupuli TaxID=559629 RepID=UPI003D993919